MLKEERKFPNRDRRQTTRRATDRETIFKSTSFPGTFTNVPAPVTASPYTITWGGTDKNV